jgi:hypothetical protein
VRRRLAALLIACLAVPALALAGHQEPKRQINAADERKAASIVLKRTDFVAGWKKLPNSPPDNSHVDCSGQPSEADLVLTGDAESDFERPEGFPSIYSFSDIYKTAANARASWTRGVKPALAACMAKLMKNTIETEEGATATVVSAGRIAFPKYAPLTAAFRAVLRVTFTENGETTTVPLTMHVVALAQGRGQAGLLTMSFGAGVPMADLRAFAMLLGQRLAAAKL